MEALSEIPLLTMPGPQFLLFYGFAAGVAVAAFLLFGVERGDARPPPVPARPDPYELAYLRDGAGGVVWLAIYALKRAGLVELTDSGRLRPLGGAPPGNRFEAAALRAIGAGCSTAALLRDSEMAAPIRALEAALARKGLAPTKESRARTWRIAAGLGVALIALAAAKIAVAAAHGRHNIGFLLLECLGAVAVLAVLAANAATAKANPRGRAYLDRVKLAYEGRRDEPADGFASTAALLAVGVYGFHVLASGPEKAFAKQAQSGGGCSSGSCSSGGGSCGGGGCGGCGGS